jgi:hypothetical protein
MPKFPGAVQHNNPVEAILSLPENQVKGLGVFADVAARSALNANMRSEGFIAVVTGLDKVYIYTVASILDADWQNTANWTEIGSGGGGGYTLPIASSTVLGGIKVGTNLSIDANGVLSSTDTNTTYTAGNGLTLSGTEFNVGGTANRITVTTDAIDIASTYVGQNTISIVGTINTGTWTASPIADAYITGISANKITGTVAVANGGTGATTAPSARTNLGATTVGSNLFTLTNPSAITFPRINADNTVSARSAAEFRTDIGAGTGNGTVTSVGISVPTGLSVSNTPVTGSGTIAIGLSAGYSIPTTSSQANWDTAFTDRMKWDGGSTGLVASTARTSLGLVINTDVQAYDADLAAIAALTGTSGLLRKTAADTWTLDTITYANDSVVVKSVNSLTPTNGGITLYGTAIQRSTTNSQSVSAGITAAEGNILTLQNDVVTLYEAIQPISKDVTKTRFGFSTTSAALETTETTGSFFRGSTGYFFTQASPGVTEIKVLDDSATPVQRTILYGVGRVNGAQVGIHNTTPSYPLDITGNTRVTGNIIVSGTVDGVDISELKNTVDNITVGGTEEIELFSYFIS